MRRSEMGLGVVMGMDLSELIDAVDIVDYISQFVELTEKGGEFWG